MANKLKQLIILATIIPMLLMVGCTSNVDREAQNNEEETYPERTRDTVYVNQFGVNDDSSNLFCYDVSLDDRMHISLQTYNLTTGEINEVFKVDDLEKEHITKIKRSGEVVSFQVDGDNLMTYYEYNLLTGTIEKIKEESPIINDNPLVSEATVDAGEYGLITFKKAFKDNAFSYSFDGENYIEIPDFADKDFHTSGVFSSDLTYADGKVYGVFRAVHGKIAISDPIFQTCGGVIKEVFFSFDPSTCEFVKLYETANGYSRIVGYCDGGIYVYKNGNLSKVNLASKELESICDIDVKDVTFSCIGDKLIILDQKKEEVIKVVDMK
ncbi:hypothetical protein [Butyrivibrio sp. AE3009]|uniref:hypothetical protein n=1 Tax=Butyrivibrio sp. AE3009 TaxID=1280666 RepID=UPI0003B451D5|nr:hypothetical protein [Butyrivibrio sp. AE3009]